MSELFKTVCGIVQQHDAPKKTETTEQRLIRMYCAKIRSSDEGAIIKAFLVYADCLGYKLRYDEEIDETKSDDVKNARSVFFIGGYAIQEDLVDETKIRIHCKDGEGGQFDRSDFERCISNFYKEHF